MKKIIHCTLVLLTCIFLSSCKNGITDIGLDMLDDQMATSFTDTVTLEAYSVLEDTINTTNLSANFLGHLSDPVFGNSAAGIFTQVALNGAAVNFGENPVIDSIVLTLQISGYYGDTTSAVGIRVHQLTEEMNKETTYYMSSTVGYDPAPLNYSLDGITLQPTTPIVVDTGMYNAHMRIRLSQQFGQYLLNHQDDLNNNLQSFLKGLYIEAVSHSGAHGYMMISNLTSALSGLTLYYHNNSEQALRYAMTFSDKSARFTHVTHDYAASQSNNFVEEVLQGQHNVGERMLFLQGGGGVKTRISFPYLKEAFAQYNNRVVIHRAELVITDLDPNNSTLTHPTALTLQGIGLSDSAIRFLPDDDYYTSTIYFGGTYDGSNKEYRFRITKYVQQLILGQGDWSSSVNLIVRGSGVRPHRLVFDGTDPASPTRLRLEIAYSTY